MIAEITRYKEILKTQLTLTYHRVCDFRCLGRRRSQLRSARADERSAWHCAAKDFVRSANECRSSPPTHPLTNILNRLPTAPP
ncbi:unnamed protein product [Arctia plantaginis]|uniref:Uncharacterized protein n=1 Tax=Arctia plantaginis TaxID=874455 RepID=A0A8S1APV2_ARCPL|nr:unnamed protein product [Arctia plantaginis]